MAKITTDIFKKRVLELGNKEYELKSEYINVKTKVKLIHLECGYEYEVIADHILREQGYQCPKCKGKRLQKIFKKSTEEYQQQLNTFIGNEDYKVISDYINQRTKIKVLHTICNTEFEALPNKILYGSKRCPKCFPNKSLGEMLVEQYLINNNLKYSLQYTFNNCISSKQKLLRFDFAIFNENNILDYLIEYDGQQHYSPVEIFGGEKSFKAQKENDNLKDNFCNKNSIKLIRIPYQIDNYEKLVSFMEDRK